MRLFTRIPLEGLVEVVSRVLSLPAVGMITIATISQESRRSVRAWAVLAPLIPLRALDGEMRNEGTQEGKKAERSHEDEAQQEHKASISF